MCINYVLDKLGCLLAMEQSNRLSYVDTAKYLALFFVILSHSGISGTILSKFLFTFHVPLFCVYSGYVRKPVGKYAVGGVNYY